MDSTPPPFRALPPQTSSSASSINSPSRRSARIAHVLAAALALCIAAYLTNEKWQGRITNLVGCGGEEGCSQLLGGRWANWMLVPVSFWALTVYAPLLVLGLLGINTRRRLQLAWIGVGILTAAALWFLGLQLFVEHRFCKYCFAMHACSVVLLVTTSLHARQLTRANVSSSEPSAPNSIAPPAARVAWIAGSIAALALIGGQLFGPQPATHQLTENTAAASTNERAEIEVPPRATSAPSTPADSTPPDPSPARSAPATADDELPDLPDLPDKADAANTEDVPDQETTAKQPPPRSAGEPAANSGARPLRFLDGALVFDLQEMPVIGSTQAGSVIVKYFDYTCKSCRTMHGELEAVQRQYPGQLAVVMLPCPLDRNCNPAAPPGNAHRDACIYARLALAVWRADREQFPKFHDELFQLQGNLTPAIARKKAVELVGEAALSRAEQDPWIAKTLDKTFSIYRIMARQNPRMPKVVLGGTVILHGVTVSQSDLVGALEKYAGLKNATAGTP